MGRCHWIRAARQNPTTIGVEVGKEVAALEYVARQREFTDGDAARGMDIGGGRVADVPARRLQQPVDIPPRLLFWLWRQDIPFYLSAESSHIRLGERIVSTSSQHYFTNYHTPLTCRAPRGSVLPSRWGKRIDLADSTNPYRH